MCRLSLESFPDAHPPRHRSHDYFNPRRRVTEQCVYVAMNGLMAEIIEGHIRLHVVDPDTHPTSEQSKAAQELIDLVRAYLK
jgi:hypothetical protein